MITHFVLRGALFSKRLDLNVTALSPLGSAHRLIARAVENNCCQQEDASPSQTL